MKGGIIDRFRSLDVSATSILAGHVVASTVRNLFSTALVLGVGLLIGFRPSAPLTGWLAAGGILVVFLVALSWLSAAVGLLARTPEAAAGFTFFMMFLPYPSSAFVPIETMPTWLHGFADHQPVTPLIEALRGLLHDQPVGSAPWLALAWCGGILAVAVALSGVLFKVRTA
jgi:ABC-2 type transport system permease protein